MPDYTNRFKQSLKAGKANIGLWISIPDAFTTEICATAEFDWMLLDGEHTPNDPRTVLSQLQALAAYNTQAVARPAVGDTHVLKQLLDVGVQNLLIPMVDTPEQARGLVQAVRYPPHGIRGVGYGTARVSRWDARKDYAQGAKDEVCLLVQVETALGLSNLDAICQVEGVDGVFLEVHEEPSRAKSDAQNALALDQLGALLDDLVAIHAVVTRANAAARV